METPEGPITVQRPRTVAGNYKITTAFLCFAAMAMFLAMNTLAGVQFDAGAWVLPLVLPLSMGMSGWNIGRRLTPEEERQQADISRWDV